MDTVNYTIQTTIPINLKRTNRLKKTKPLVQEGQDQVRMPPGFLKSMGFDMKKNYRSKGLVLLGIALRHGEMSFQAAGRELGQPS